MKPFFSYLPRLVVLALLFLSVDVSAEAPPGQLPPGRREARQYVRQRVVPVVRQQRLKLEPYLTSADQAQLAGYRDQLHRLHQQQRLFRRPPHGEPRPAAQREQAREVGAARQQLMQAVAQLAQRYETLIAQLAAEVQPQRGQWMADLRAIQQKYAPQADSATGSQSRRAYPATTLPDAYFAPARFLLLAPKAPPALRPAPAGAKEKTGGPITIYPNPIVFFSQVQYLVQKPGTVLVELLNSQGTTLRTLLQETQEKGAHALPLPTQELTRGTYYIKITTRTGTDTRRFVKN